MVDRGIGFVVVTEGNKIVRWGGDRTLDGRVRTVPPRGGTEIDVSALGVGEQRVEVLVDVTGSPTRLGTGYRVVARFVPWQGAKVLQVPQSALFRHGGGWAVFAVRGGRAERQPAGVGHRGGPRAQIVDGLGAGIRVATRLGDELSDGMRVATRRRGFRLTPSGGSLQFRRSSPHSPRQSGQMPPEM